MPSPSMRRLEAFFNNPQHGVICPGLVNRRRRQMRHFCTIELVRQMIAPERSFRFVPRRPRRHRGTSDWHVHAATTGDGQSRRHRPGETPRGSGRSTSASSHRCLAKAVAGIRAELLAWVGLTFPKGGPAGWPDLESPMLGGQVRSLGTSCRRHGAPETALMTPTGRRVCNAAAEMS